MMYIEGPVVDVVDVETIKVREEYAGTSVEEGITRTIRIHLSSPIASQPSKEALADLLRGRRVACHVVEEDDESGYVVAIVQFASA